MAKSVALGLEMLFVILAMAPIMVYSHSQHPITTAITLYSQVIFSGPNANEVRVAGSNPPRNSRFGVLSVVDFLLTEGINGDSPPVGRFQAIRAVSSIDGTHLYNSVCIIFDYGKYRGSTLQIQGTVREADDVVTGEFSVPSGTEPLRFVRGYVEIRTVTQATNTSVVDQLKIFLQDGSH